MINIFLKLTRVFLQESSFILASHLLTLVKAARKMGYFCRTVYLFGLAVSMIESKFPMDLHVLLQ